MSTRKIIPVILLSAILFSIILYYPFTAIADCPCEDEGCYLVIIHINGAEGYQPHDELVMLRESGDNGTAPILYETRCNNKGVVQLCVESGTYWIDIRNIWVTLVIDDDIEFIFPYELYEDAEGYTGNETQEQEDNGLGVVSTGLVLLTAFVSILFLIRYKKNKRYPPIQ